VKKFLFIALLFASTAAMAEGASAGDHPGKKGEMAAKPEMSFEEHKAKVLQRITTHIAKAQERQACVQAASDREALRACMPEGWGQGKGKPGKWQHEGGKKTGQKNGEGKPADAPEMQ